MRSSILISILAVVGVATLPHVPAQSQPSQQPGKIVRVEKRNVTKSRLRSGSDPDRGPLQSHYSVYAVSVQLTCAVYAVRYESEFNDLPPSMVPGDSVPVRVGKHILYLDFPAQSLRTQIVRRETSHAAGCSQKMD